MIREPIANSRTPTSTKGAATNCRKYFILSPKKKVGY